MNNKMYQTLDLNNHRECAEMVPDRIDYNSRYSHVDAPIRKNADMIENRLAEYAISNKTTPLDNIHVSSRYPADNINSEPRDWNNGKSFDSNYFTNHYMIPLSIMTGKHMTRNPAVLGLGFLLWIPVGMAVLLVIILILLLVLVFRKR